jgi:hypothetical protein
LRAARLLALLMLIISAYIPLQKNAGMKLLCHFGFGIASLFWTPYFFGCPLPLYFLSGVLMDFGGDTSNHSSTEKPDHTGRVAAVNSIL